MNHPPTDLDPRTTMRADLVAAARREAAVRRRRRRATLAAAVATALLGTAAATAAIGGHSTGVPVLDEVLAISAERRHGPTPPMRNAPFDVRPGPGGSGPPMKLPGPNGVESPGIGVAYVNRSGHICFVSVGPERRADRGGVGCTSTKIVGRWLDRTVAAVTTAGGQFDGRLAVAGFARSDVAALALDGPDGPIQAVLGDAWKPAVAGLRRLRPFVVFLGLDARQRRPRELLRLVGGDLTATLADGRVVVARR